MLTYLTLSDFSEFPTRFDIILLIFHDNDPIFSGTFKPKFEKKLEASIRNFEVFGAISFASIQDGTIRTQVWMR